jgi:type III secretory pathway lipoprotein EscJ
MGEWTEVYVTQMQEEAAVIEALLRSEGIEARTESDDAGGMGPSLGWLRGFRVMVPAERASEAQALIEAD